MGAGEVRPRRQIARLAAFFMTSFATSGPASSIGAGQRTPDVAECGPRLPMNPPHDDAGVGSASPPNHADDQPRSPAAHLVAWRWQRGNTGNPSGRPPLAFTIASIARAKTRNGEELVDFFVGVMRGEPMLRPGRPAQLPRP
jgi:hypothetical protein